MSGSDLGPDNYPLPSGVSQQPTRIPPLMPDSFDKKGASKWMNDVVVSLSADEVTKVKNAVANRLRSYDGSLTGTAEDGLFAEHTWLTIEARNGRIATLAPVELWNGSLMAEAKQAETRLSSKVHKGAPNYNCALCCSLAGKFDDAYSFITEAAEEDCRSFGAKPETLLSGTHPLSKQLLIDPLKPLLSK